MEKIIAWWKLRRLYTRVGIVLTVLWPLVVSAYLFFNSSGTGILELKPNEFGDFCAGLFAPLAFLWLVIGYAQQGEELAQNVEALNLQARETAQLARQARQQAQETAEMARHAKKQSVILSQNEQHARRDLFFEMARQTVEELRQTAFYFCLRFDEANNVEWSGKRTYVMTALQNGYADGAAHYLADYLVQHNGQTHFGSLRMRTGFLDAVNQFISDFENLLTSADIASGGDKKLRRFYEGTAIARLYLQLCLRVQKPNILGQ